MPQPASPHENLASALIVWVTLAFCLIAWRCSADDLKTSSDKIRLDGRLERLEARLKELEKDRAGARLDGLEREIRVINARR